MKLGANGFPRRNQMVEWTPAEKTLFDAVQVVEAAGCHPLLTDAVNLLQAAREKVADFVELEPDLTPTTAIVATARWVPFLDIFPQSENKIWVRFCGVDGMYRWLHPTENRWVDEPDQIEMPMFPDYRAATKAANESPQPPTWGEYAASKIGAQ